MKTQLFLLVGAGITVFGPSLLFKTPPKPETLSFTASAESDFETRLEKCEGRQVRLEERLDMLFELYRAVQK